MPPAASISVHQGVEALPGFLFVEVAGGIVLGSLALLADAAHMVSDVVGLALAMAGTVLVGRPLNSRHSFGFAHAEVLAAHLSAQLLLGGGLWIVVEAVGRLVAPEPQPVMAAGLMAVAKQYSSQTYADYADKPGIARSVGKTGVCWDVARAESPYGTLKNETVDRAVHPARKHARFEVGPLHRTKI